MIIGSTKFLSSYIRLGWFGPYDILRNILEYIEPNPEPSKLSIDLEKCMATEFEKIWHFEVFADALAQTGFNEAHSDARNTEAKFVWLE